MVYHGMGWGEIQNGIMEGIVDGIGDSIGWVRPNGIEDGMRWNEVEDRMGWNGMEWDGIGMV